MSIQEDIKTLTELNKEITRLSKQLNKLRKDTKEINGRITAYITAKDQVGVKYEGSAFILDKKTRPVAKPKKTKEEGYIQVIEQYGIENAKGFLEELLKAGQVEKEVTKLKIRLKTCVKSGTLSALLIKYFFVFEFDNNIAHILNVLSTVPIIYLLHNPSKFISTKPHNTLYLSFWNLSCDNVLHKICGGL